MLSHPVQTHSSISAYEEQLPSRSDELRPNTSSNFPADRYELKGPVFFGHQQLHQPADVSELRYFSRPLHLKTHRPSDHLLRRKTPNGTLPAGYDGSHQSPGSPAQKHVLVPTSRFARGPPSQVGPTRFLDVAPHIQEHSTSRPALRTNPEQPSRDGDPPRNATPTVNLGKHTLDLRIRENIPRPLDSVLNQSSTKSQSSAWPAHSVPTVLQPLWPPCLGPTALQSPGPMGPYWPDGAFEPYRPTPLQGLRHGRSQDPTFDSTENVDDSQVCGSSEHTGFDQRENLVEKHSWGQEALATSELYDLKRFSCIVASSRAMPDHSKSSFSHNFTESSTTGALTSGTSLSASSHQIEKPLVARLTIDQAHFREKTLHWAYRTYCNLLANFEDSRRESIGSQLPTPNQRLRRPYPSWTRNGHDSASNVSYAGSSDRDLVSDEQYSPSFLSSPMHHSRRILAKQVPNSLSWRLPIRNSASHIDTVNAPGMPEKLTQRIQTPASVHSQSQKTHLHNDRDAVVAVALKAMEVLSRLCQESHWQWLDGMLLNGCLAYGLRQFSKATKWYLKVLRQDPINAEAMSNLAATCLALGRKDEAEQYWIRAIKQRPAYFEAVEHLVGILHDDGRGQDAVGVISHVQARLRDENLKYAQRLRAPLSNASGYAISPFDNGRLLALIHGKGNVLYQSGDNGGAAQAFEDAILIGTGQFHHGICGLINHVSRIFLEHWEFLVATRAGTCPIDRLVLLPPEVALETSRLVFPPYGRLPGLMSVPRGAAQKAAISIISNSLLSLAKIYQDSMSSNGAKSLAPSPGMGVQDILALYYLSLSLQPSPSTANNVGILLAGIQQPAKNDQFIVFQTSSQPPPVSGVVSGSGVALALAYYDYGLRLDAHHAHLYTNLGSLFKDIGHLSSAIRMYEKAVECDGNFDIALANLANAVKDRGNIRDAIEYYRRAVVANPDFAEAVCGLANALNSVCNWRGRGGVYQQHGKIDRWHVDEQGILYDSHASSLRGSGWMEHVICIVQKQLVEGQAWGKGAINSEGFGHLVKYCLRTQMISNGDILMDTFRQWSTKDWEGAKVVRLVERATKVQTWRLYRQTYLCESQGGLVSRARPQLPTILAVPSAPTVLPFHTFTCPLTAKQIRLISQRNALRVSCTTLKAPWLPSSIYEPPPPPNPQINVGYVSSDFNNHPLAHLMQSVFGMHNTLNFKATCYATTTSDGSIHRKQIEQQSPCFRDCSTWPTERIVNQIVDDHIHILVNLNGYTRGAKNEVFAARPAPVQMSFMGFAGTLGAEWCDYLLADEHAIPLNTLRPYRRNVSLIDQLQDANHDDDELEWVYGENIIYAKETFFCCDHKQSAPDAQERRLSWFEESRRRQAMRNEIFPDLPHDVVILGNFNQLYKIEPTTFRTWLRILSRVPKAVLWLLRFPDLGEQHLKETAEKWVGAEVASRLRFTDVAPKQHHISRASVCDLFLDTPECNAHTTAADVLWSGTPLLTYPKHEYKMCSRMAASILRGALPRTEGGDCAFADLLAQDDESYEERAVELAHDLMVKSASASRSGSARLLEIRRLLFESRWTSALFDTRRWVSDLETAYATAWSRWVDGIGGDIWI